MTNTKAYLRTLALGLMMGASSSGMLEAQITLDPAWRVTPDTTKPGFKWSYFQDGINTGDNNARAERDLAGQSPNPNQGDPTVIGAAIAEAAPANPENGLLYFEITNVINLSKVDGDSRGNFTPDALEPGLNGSVSSDGQAAEILTYLTLPAGTNTMGVVSDDGFQTSSGSNPSDALGRVVLGEYSGGRGAGLPGTLFTFVVQQAGTYPFRTIWENGGGDSSIEWFTVDPDGVSNLKLINDVANGGIPAYRAASGAAPPFVKSVTPPAVPRQTESISRNVTVVLADGSTAVDTNSITLTIDGAPATITKERAGNLVTVDTGVLPGFHAAGEAHTAVLTYKDVPGTSHTAQWTFYNLENLILPANPVTGENFDSYPEAISAATTVPPGWVATNATYMETPGWDLTDIKSDAFLDWVLISTNTVFPLEDEVLINNTAQTINGIPLTNGWMSGNLIFVASDGRASKTPDGDLAPQAQFVISAPFNLSTVTNPVVTFSSGARLSIGNPDQMTMEYSVDGGASWLPVIYMRSSSTLALLPDGSFDALAMFNTVNTNQVPFFPTPGVGPRGGKWGDMLAAPISQALAPYIANRNDGIAARRVEAIRLPQASKKSDVRLRLTHLSHCGWEWGVDNIAFYDIAPAVTAPSGNINIGLNFGANDNSANLGLTAAAVAGVVPQANWNNLNGANGTNFTLVGDSGGSSAATSASVTWSCPNTWSNTGRGEENNGFPAGANRTLMTGYLDTDNAAGVVRITVSGLDSAFGGAAYDVIVYALGGTSANRYGAYSIGTVTNVINSTASPTNFVLDAGVNVTDTGNYGVFKDVTGSSFTLIASAVTPFGNGTRAPVNAVQIVKSPPRLAITPQGGSVRITFPTSVKLQSTTSLSAPVTWSDVPGTSPLLVPITGSQVYYRGSPP